MQVDDTPPEEGTGETEEDCSAEFKPLVQLDEVEKESGEEGETALVDMWVTLSPFPHRQRAVLHHCDVLEVMMSNRPQQGLYRPWLHEASRLQDLPHMRQQRLWQHSAHVAAARPQVRLWRFLSPAFCLRMQKGCGDIPQ